MKALAFLLGGVLLGVGAHYVGSRLSSDAIGLIVGLLFGMLAFVPPALLILFAQRRPGADEQRRQEQARWLLEEERRRLEQARQAAQLEAQRWQALEQHGRERRRLTVYHEEE